MKFRPSIMMHGIKEVIIEKKGNNIDIRIEGENEREYASFNLFGNNHNQIAPKLTTKGILGIKGIVEKIRIKLTKDNA